VIWLPARRKVRPRYRRKKPGSMKWLMKILTFILILFALYYFVHSSFFALSSIQVTGMKQISSKDIINLSGLAKGENIFKIDLKAAEKKFI
jgi:cell division septal protein FtsQ